MDASTRAEPRGGSHELQPRGILIIAQVLLTAWKLSALEKACQGRTFAQRRDAAIIAVFKATGIRVSELAGIRYRNHAPLRGAAVGHGNWVPSCRRPGAVAGGWGLRGGRGSSGRGGRCTVVLTCRPSSSFALGPFEAGL